MQVPPLRSSGPPTPIRLPDADGADRLRDREATKPTPRPAAFHGGYRAGDRRPAQAPGVRQCLTTSGPRRTADGPPARRAGGSGSSTVSCRASSSTSTRPGGASRKSRSAREEWTVGRAKSEWMGAARVLASNGYVLRRVGRNHHLSDCRGYAYEHRLMAEDILGRRLRRGEVVHHRNHRKDDNRAANIEVCKSIAHHREMHRLPGNVRQRHDQPNPIVSCRCGCGAKFRRFDSSGRPRRFVTGHNTGAKYGQAR